jgi:outer membrane biosynthesis protein TonB
MKKLHKAVIGILGGITLVSGAAGGVQASASHGYSTNPPTQQKSYADLAYNLMDVAQPTAKPSPTPTAKPSSKPTPTPTPKPSTKPTPTPTPKLSPKVSATPYASPSAKVSPKITPTPEPKPTAKVSPKGGSLTETVMGTIVQTYKNIFVSLKAFFKF